MEKLVFSIFILGLTFAHSALAQKELTDRETSALAENILNRKSESGFFCCGEYWIFDEGKKSYDPSIEVDADAYKLLQKYESGGFIKLEDSSEGGKEKVRVTLKENIPGTVGPDKKYKLIWIKTILELAVKIVKVRDYTNGIEDFKLLMFTVNGIYNPWTPVVGGTISLEGEYKKKGYMFLVYDDFSSDWKTIAWKDSWRGEKREKNLLESVDISKDLDTERLERFIQTKGIRAIN